MIPSRWSRNNKSKDPSNNLNIRYIILWFCIWTVTTMVVLAVLAVCFNIWNCPVHVWCLCNLLLSVHEPQGCLIKSHALWLHPQLPFFNCNFCAPYMEVIPIFLPVFCTQCHHRNWLIPLCLLTSTASRKDEVASIRAKFPQKVPVNDPTKTSHDTMMYHHATLHIVHVMCRELLLKNTVTVLHCSAVAQKL